MSKVRLWLIPFGWMALIYFASSQPYEQQNIKPLLSDRLDLSYVEPLIDHVKFTYNQSEVSVHALGVEGFVEFFVRKGAHLGVFFMLFFFVYYALTKTTRFQFNTRLFVSFIWAVTYAGIDEWHQSFTVNRTPYIGDVIIDAFGALLALAIVMVAHHYKKRR
ncbi:VanZ family protein [Lentibacillus saliphilus]|uniref:VanZ family protein n=1 Tax=Lentibacillus saliphilus TaxID=2737028 RepID=UPI001C2F3170|nr:VanZ family protein [Lentibacillus saliphilus]